MRVDLSGKIVIITGAAGGIGKACAKRMLQNDAIVVIADIDKMAGQSTAQELAVYGKCIFIENDVSSEISVNRLLETTLNEFARIDIFINNAGINSGGKRVNVNEFTIENWNKVIAVDLTGVFMCSRRVATVMIEQKQGRIINIGSVFGSIPARRQIAYIAAKAGVHNMTKAMALELAQFGINVNAIAPGSILTEGTKSLFYSKDAAQAEFAQKMLSHIPMSRPGDVDDIANAALFLAGDCSKYITGHVLTVDGGWSCGYSRDF
ncbi:MAG: hypothetical protein A2Y12_03790 [Planctomycetes bacterium GWF2_42_9]|nr:MAG: hypothetical protein A2Y12_03790 [Planctomycetes bacterium GWF2_42_9]